MPIAPGLSAPGVSFRDENGFTYIDVNNRHATACFCTHGAHALSYVPHGQKPVLWLSDHAAFRAGKAIRGGIPICWPWFGSHPSDDSLPSHGFARTSEWELVAVSGSEEVTELTFELTDSEVSREIWDWQFRLRLCATIGSVLTVALTTENNDQKPMPLTQALHSYFTVSDIVNLAVSGLENTDYLDQVGETQRKTQVGSITFEGEVDRDYLDTQSECVIHDSGFKRQIHIAKEGSNSTVVWNPWIDKAARMADFGDDEYRTMVCVETTNATEFDTVLLQSGAVHTLSATLSAMENSSL